ncbi:MULTISPECIES: glycosyltransferase family 2 protein [Bacteroides]|uniref:glycosyltransferase family 2 protein n=1 Tax=Bacteroides TaxID=816 RepID=UPI00189CA672|nr:MULTISPECIES: glycosyltransferase family 2 protein [Bacteroides]MDC1767453.1 glycosyltransferase family 2 protein [Bacteroides uniformis]MDC1771077.1 glycosyltransferase family 2 protein [Bacteroides uniformis]MDC1777314.1 glycosyltransferase family 2 protein [Bacteroides uniformis]MDC1778787.1 glycosyltransferase family 2 protein [Bacteroides uniformis]
MRVKVSVVVPVFGVEKFIERCARSLFEQTLDDIEFIFINDCSPDASMQILRTVLEDYPHRKNQVLIINHPINQGAAKARENGIKAATGEYIIHCDSDDWVDRDMYRMMYEKAKTEDLDCVLCRSLYYSDGNEHHIVTDIIKQDKIDFIRDILYCRTTVALYNRLVKKELYQSSNIIYPANHMMEDRAYSVQIAYYAKSYGCVDGPFYYYFQNSNSICGNNSEDAILSKFRQAVANLRIVEDFLKEKGLYCQLRYALYHSQFVVIGLLNVLLKNNNNTRRLWMNTFPKVKNILWFSAHIPFSLKIISLFIITGTYPMVNKLLHGRTK